ncbi:class I SAM-dependent DNA methyltransferase [Rhodoferax sp. 4810]|uniref:site-specific DNA-methyltransferase (adenine-specific) n=1 Tax=Thiospirillum jenense TaxID=1653858 RepID=A0A839HLK1_9GAMM|nr:DNA methyltransferase [Thiospirillum jenense]MBB1077754.1 class I SAM-dependent DNA methyltransferase [Rhodoferax jenense]MBB1127317.1 class I SAM-dependent DNA methyltransferase [Thiospirillum jenense]
MPLSWNEMKTRALAFAHRWQDAGRENSDAKPFLIDFFEIFGVTNKRLATFEYAMTKYGEQQGFIDLFWPGVLIVEMKSRGKDLTAAYQQALAYCAGIKEQDLPRYVLVSDFATLQLTDLETNQTLTFPLAELVMHISAFGFIAGYTTQVIQPQDPINIKAAERMGVLHDQLKAVGYTGHALEVYLVRLLFCLFAEDTGIFTKRQFQELLIHKTRFDGSDVGAQINLLFHVLNTPPTQRLTNLDEDFAAFQYINGQLFNEILPPASFDRAMRETLLRLCALDWSRISPAIFGSLFQSIMTDSERRNLGAHYTSEENILKLIKPLFLDALWAQFNQLGNHKAKLAAFHDQLAALTFLDPACGCGNFLVIAYRELRKLELELLKKLHKKSQLLEIDTLLKLNVNQFYGIEIEEFPAQIAQVALWLTDHQMNQQVSATFGVYFARIPLTTAATIIHANALQVDWQSVCPNASFIIGNPPFVGKNFRTAQQTTDLERVFYNTPQLPVIKSYKSLDLVCAWYYRAAAYIQTHLMTRTAFVSTNSITQGEQVAILWQPLLTSGVQIHFAHRTFSWSNEAKGKAAVHVVIIGFALQPAPTKTLFIYADIKGEPQAVTVANINPYLIDAPDILIAARRKPLCAFAPIMTRGSQPTDGGHLLLNQAERDELIQIEPQTEQYVKPFSMGDEFINHIPRYCLWLVDCPPNKLRHMPEVLKRVEAVKTMRLNSNKAATREWATKPMLFTEIRQPLDGSYLAVPRVSSEHRQYVPIGFLPHTHIAGDKLQTIPNATIYHFGIMTSAMHNAWMRITCGRLGSSYSYSAKIVYNNFPWPNTTDNHLTFITNTAQAVLTARARFPNSSLADLYDPRTMPPVLTKAHAKLDKAVDAAYRYTGGNDDSERITFLFRLYQQQGAASK